MRYRVCGLLIVVTFMCATAEQLITLQEISTYVSAIPEDIVQEKTDSWLDPDYSLFYQQLFNVPYQSALMNSLYGFFARPVSPLCRKETIYDAISAFNSLEYREIAKDAQGVEYEQLTVAPGSELVVFGDLHGALHSFVRTLHRLEKQGYIDSLLHIKNPNTYFVFLGDYLNRSPYGFPLLIVLLHFAARNPKQVFLLRGNQESEGHWESFLASRQFLQQLFGEAGETVLPLSAELNNIFIRLPNALVVTHQDTDEVVVCAHSKIPEQTTVQPKTQAFLLGETRKGKWLNRGLIFEEFLYGSAAWHLFSAPVQLYREYGGLSDDAWCSVSVGERFARDSIVYHHAHRPKKNNKNSISIDTELKREEYSLAYGQVLRSEQDRAALEMSKPYFLCSSGDLSASLRTVTQGTKRGVEACILEANQQRGVHNYFFRAVFLNDEYIPVKMTENVRLLRERYHIDALIFPQGSAPLKELMPQIKRGDFFVFFPYTGSSLLRTPDLTSIIHTRQPYFDEVGRLVDHFQARHFSKKIAIVFQDDAFGRPIAEYVAQQLNEKFTGVSVELVPFVRGQLSMEQQLAQLKDFNPEAIGFFITNPAQISTIITDLGINNFVGKHIFALAFEEFFVDVASRWGVRALFSSSFQPPRMQQGELMHEFLELMSRYHYFLNIPAYEAFVGTKLFLEAMRKVEPPITSEKIMRQIEAFSGTNFGGLFLRFDPQIRGFSLPVWIFEEDGTVSSIDPRVK